MLRPIVNDLACGIELRSIPEAKFVSPLVEISGSTPAYSVHKKALFACAYTRRLLIPNLVKLAGILYPKVAVCKRIKSPF